MAGRLALWLLCVLAVLVLWRLRARRLRICRRAPPDAPRIPPVQVGAGTAVVGEAGDRSRAQQSGVPVLVPGRPEAPPSQRRRATAHRVLLRAFIAGNLLFGLYYISWRYADSINWAVWPIALTLLAAETYSYLDAWLFGLTMWRLRRRGGSPPPPAGATADVFITCYNEPPELVRETVRAAIAIQYPHRTYVLDDGNSPAMGAMAEEEGAGYIVRTDDWRERPRHAKAGNLNNALLQTSGEFILVLDADQIPSPSILDATLGYFREAKVAFVQTPQWFYNVPSGDPFGSQAPLFYGPIQQAKDGWNAAFFCGSNAVLRREALMQLGIHQYVRELDARVRQVLRSADRLLRAAERELPAAAPDHVRGALRDLRTALADTGRALSAGMSIQEATWQFQRRAEATTRGLVAHDLARLRSELAAIPGLDIPSEELANLVGDEDALRALTGRTMSPLAAISTVRQLLQALDVDRADEAQPVMPMATISVTEDMATAMRLHALGWRSVYHHEILARGLAPEDLRTALQQRLRWGQGTLQVLLRENPLSVPGLSPGQRLMYFSTMWSYVSGFASFMYLLAPALYLLFGWQPVRAYSTDFFLHLLPYLLVNQLFFRVVGWGVPTRRGQQYHLALFPLWTKAVVSAVENVYFGRKLGFVVTPKVRQGGVHWQLVWPQLTMIILLALGVGWGLLRVALGWTDEIVGVLVNAFWACYDLLALSVVLEALAYRPRDEAGEEPAAAPTPSDGRVTAAS